MVRRPPTQADLSRYETLLKTGKQSPNFWVSLEYWLRSDCEWVEMGALEGIQQTKDEWLIPPMLNKNGFLLNGMPIFAGFPDMSFPKAVFLDYQFMYDPKDFADLSGSKWEVFRKNIRKFPARNPGTLLYLPLRIDDIMDAVEDLLLKWANGRTIFDPETFTRFVLQGDNRKGLFLNNDLIGVNVWDENDTFVNFRYCVDNGMPFLNEYLRYMFYTDADIVGKGKLVNDGGALESPNLKRFKEKLNPKNVWSVYSCKGSS